MNFNTDSAISCVSKAPMLIKVSVEPRIGFPRIGVLKTSPKAPLPFALGTKTLYLFKFSVVRI